MWGMQGEATTVVEVSPVDLYRLVSDVTRMGEWSPECRGCEWTNGASGPAVGATFNGHNARGDNEWTTPNTVLVADPGREFSWVVGSPEVDLCTWGFRMEPDGDATKLTQFFELGDAPLGFRQMMEEHPAEERATIIEARRRQLVADMADTLARIKAVAEGAPATV